MVRMTDQQIVLELESIQYKVAKTYACNKLTLQEALDNLRITVIYMQFDNECLKRELEYAKKKKSEQ